MCGFFSGLKNWVGSLATVFFSTTCLLLRLFRFRFTTQPTTTALQNPNINLIFQQLDFFPPILWGMIDFFPVLLPFPYSIFRLKLMLTLHLPFLVLQEFWKWRRRCWCESFGFEKMNWLLFWISFICFRFLLLLAYSVSQIKIAISDVVRIDRFTLLLMSVAFGSVERKFVYLKDETDFDWISARNHEIVVPKQHYRQCLRR